MRKAEELFTTAPDLTAMGANIREMDPPAKDQGDIDAFERGFVELFDHYLLPAKVDRLPAERALASTFSGVTRMLCLSMVAMNSAPTAPVAPAIATTGSFFTLLSKRKLG